jgi:hypothetical protein
VAASSRFVAASSELWRLMAAAGNIQRLGRGLPACLPSRACMHATPVLPPSSSSAPPLLNPSSLLCRCPLYAFAFNRCDSTTLASLSLLVASPAACCWCWASAESPTDGDDDGWNHAAAAAATLGVQCPHVYLVRGLSPCPRCPARPRS